MFSFTVSDVSELSSEEEGSSEMVLADQGLEPSTSVENQELMQPHSAQSQSVASIRQPIPSQGSVASTSQPVPSQGSVTSTSQPVSSQGLMTSTSQTIPSQGSVTSTSQPVSSQGLSSQGSVSNMSTQHNTDSSDCTVKLG